MTVEAYLEFLKESERDGYIIELLFKEITKNVTISQKDVADWYAEAMDDDVKYYTENPGSTKPRKCLIYGTT